MRLTKNGPLGQAIAAQLGIDVRQIDGLCIIVGLPESTAVLHTFCCHEHMAMTIKAMMDEPYLDMTHEGN